MEEIIIADTLLKTYNWVDGFIVLILLLAAFRGYRSGFIRTLINLAVSIGGLLAAILYHPQVVIWLNKTFQLQEKIVGFLTPKISIPTMPSSEADPIGFLTQQILKLKLPEATLKFLTDKVEALGKINIQASAGNLNKVVAEQLSTLLENAIAFLAILLAVYLAGRILLYLLRSVLRIAGSLPDRIFGLAVGGLQGGILIVALIAFLVPILASSGQSTVAAQVSESMLANRLMSLYYSALALFS